MKVTMKVGISGTRDGAPWPARGQVVDLPDEEGVRMCAAGLASPVATHAEAEASQPEDAEQRAEPDVPAAERSRPPQGRGQRPRQQQTTDKPGD